MRVRPVLVTFLALLLCSLTLPAQAGKVYKVVDENGNITFTDKPPEPAETAARAETLHVNQDAANRTTITRVGNSEYCGEIKLPDAGDRPERFYNRLASLKTNWRHRLQRLEDAATRLSRRSRYYRPSSYNEHTTPEKLEEMRNYRCALHWAREHESTLRSQQASLVNEVDDINQHLAKLRKRKALICGAEPAFGVEDYYARRQSWRECTRDIDALIQEGEKALSEADEKLTAIQRADGH